MDARIQAVAIVGAALLLFVVFELVRRRRLMERYALLWLASGLVLLGLAIWRGALEKLANAIGVAYPPNALFFVAFAFVLVLLLHFSIAVSKLSDQTKVLAQKLAMLEESVRPTAESAPHAGAQGDGDAEREQHGQRPEEPRLAEHAAEG
jgi:hypothetical protein